MENMLEKSLLYTLTQAEITGNVFVFTNCDANRKNSYLKIIETHLDNFRKGAKVIHYRSDQFCSDFVDAALKRETKKFLAPIKEADVLILDAFERLSTREMPQIEIGRVIDSIYDRGGVVVLFTRYPYTVMKDFEDHLIRRLEYGSFWINA